MKAYLFKFSVHYGEVLDPTTEFVLVHADDYEMAREKLFIANPHMDVLSVQNLTLE